MFSLTEKVDLKELIETEEVEFKLARGRNGESSLPKDFWPTYSAFANTRGGWIILGVEETSSGFSIVGLADPDKVRRDLFNQLSDRQKVSANLLNSESDAIIRSVDSKKILIVRVKPASRSEKPVHLKSTPFKNTYRRIHEGDRKCSDDDVKKMLAEQVMDSRDQVILPQHFQFETDINIDTLKTYRNILAAHNSQHPYVSLDLYELFCKIGGWKKNRTTGEEGITLAGVLMFGTWEAITDAAPNYFVDYQERPEAKTESRWVDRVVPDGTWSGNIFDFYKKVYSKLTSDLKVPFYLEDGQRKQDTPVHTALREALVNCLVHADYSERLPILVVKRPDMFGFRNPGLSRIPLSEVLQGGLSDCRNRLLHQMFLLVGLGERAGSGLPKIVSGWKSVNWKAPKLWEKETPPQTLLELSTASLIPSGVREVFELLFGQEFDHLSDFEQLIVATAATEGWINHERACQLTTKHPRDVTLTLPRLESKGFLKAKGEQRQKTYSIPGFETPSPDDVFSQRASNGEISSSTYIGSSSLDKDTNSLDKLDSNYKSDRDKFGRLITPLLEHPVIDDVATLNGNLLEKLEVIASEPRAKKRVNRKTMEFAISELCSHQYITGAALAELISRSPEAVRQSYLKQMVENGDLELAFPQYKNHPKQAYIKKR